MRFKLHVAILMCGAVAVLASAASPAKDSPLGSPKQQVPAVHVDPVNLTEVEERILHGLNVGAVVADREAAAGIQKAADVWGLHVDLFIKADPKTRFETLATLARNGVSAIITDEAVAAESFVSALQEVNSKRGALGPLPVIVVAPERPKYATDLVEAKPSYDSGFEAFRRARAALLPQIPKYDELFNISFPITPLPDSFFQPTKFPYPEPAIRSVRTVSSTSASAHAHTSCHAVALLGNMIHRTSKIDEEIFLLGFEGGNLAIKAVPGAVTRDKLSAVMTSYVIGIRGNASERRDLLSENDGLETSAFKPAIHVPEELDRALAEWKSAGLIKGYERQGSDEVVLRGFKGADRRFRAAFFMVSSDKPLKQAKLVPGVDGYGRWTFELMSTQGFVQLFGEVPFDPPKETARSPNDLLKRIKLAEPAETARIESSNVGLIAKPLAATPRKPRGGMLTEAGAMVGSAVGFPLGTMLHKVGDAKPKFQPYLLVVEGGFLTVTPASSIAPKQLNTLVRRVDIDERGPLGSDQTIEVTLVTGEKILFRRTTLNFAYTDRALADLKGQAWISGWEYVGVRGQGLGSNIMLHNFLGKHRKFMSSLNTWPSHDRPARPYVRWYVDGMQRLNFSVVTPEGWRQEFVEIPVKIPPIPRDVQLFTGVSKLD